jgi:large subunit ribosomal protein L17
VGDVLTKKPDRRTSEESARVVHAVRMARRVVRDRGAVLKLFDEIAPRFEGRRGGYTRIVKLGQRPGDAAPMSLLELLPDEGTASSAPVETPAKGDKGAGKAAKPAADKGTAAKAPAKAKAEKKPAAPKEKTSKK